MNAVLQNIVNAFEILIYRLMLRVPWTEQRTNAAIKINAGQFKIKICLVTKIDQSYLHFFRRLVNRRRNSLKIIQGKMKRKRLLPDGRSRTDWT